MIDRVADRLAHLADLAVASFADTHDQQRSASTLDHLNVCRPCSLSLDHHAAAEALHVVFVGRTGHACFVNPDDLMARVRQSRGQVAVVCENQQTFGVEVQTADWIDVFTHVDEIDDGRPLLRVRARGHIALRLVEQ